jgi:hypothetical protein
VAVGGQWQWVDSGSGLTVTVGWQWQWVGSASGLAVTVGRQWQWIDSGSGVAVGGWWNGRQWQWVGGGMADGDHGSVWQCAAAYGSGSGWQSQ